MSLLSSSMSSWEKVFGWLLLLGLSLSPNSIVQGRSDFGEYCDKSVRCDSGASLTCQNGTCGCLKPDSMIFETRRGQCVALAGERCRFTVVEEYRSWLEEVNCVQNAQCVSLTGVCSCDSGFIELTDGTCVPKREFGERCNNTLQCRSDRFLQCVEGECKCEVDISVYNFAQMQCVGLADTPCLNDLCTHNAICRGYYGSHSVSSYEEYSGEDTKCLCSSGFSKSQDGLCQAGHGASCDYTGTKCLDKFNCRDGLCACKFPDHQVYDEVYRECYSRVGGPCTPNANSKSAMYCSKPAVCAKSGAFRFQCSCPEGMVENAERRCELSFGRICQVDHGLKCDQLAPLHCIQGKCQCADEFKIFDARSKKCRGLVGSSCNHTDLFEPVCIDGATCKRFRGSSIQGRCECLENYEETGNRTCVEVKKKD